MTLSLKVLSRTCCEIAGFSTFTSSHWVSTPCPLRRRFGRGLSFFSLVLAGVTFSTLTSSFNDLLPSHLTAFQPKMGAKRNNRNLAFPGNARFRLFLGCSHSWLEGRRMASLNCTSHAAQLSISRVPVHFG